jgi:UDP-N-acetylglucosamine 2-epimerase (non-hydrolysing)/GDP/UDP-N,N'-diacetylbacillosamine 2-epimerase (hydrolysing)
MKRTISITTGTRADYGILRPVLKEIEKSRKLKLILIVTGMHLSKKHGYTINDIKKEKFKISTKFQMIPKGNTNYDMSVVLGKGVIQFSKVFKKFKPDINIILGDRDEALASALASYHMNIPNAHIHGGDKTLAGIDEYNRHAITKISNIHFAATQKSKNRILKMGENKKNIFLTGSPSIDDIIKGEITSKKNLEKKYSIKLSGDEILLLQHPVTTQSNESKNQIKNILTAIMKSGKRVLVILPNSDAGNNEIFQEINKIKKKQQVVKIFKTLPRMDYLGLLKNCGILIGNSSSGMIDSSYFGIPVVNIGIRQQNRERGSNVIDVTNYSNNLILKAINQSFKHKNKIHQSKPYGVKDASKKIRSILEVIEINDKLIQKQITYD